MSGLWGLKAMQQNLHPELISQASEVDPTLALLLVEILSQDRAKQAVDVLARRESDMPGMVEGEPAGDDRAAQPACP